MSRNNVIVSQHEIVIEDGMSKKESSYRASHVHVGAAVVITFIVTLCVGIGIGAAVIRDRTHGQTDPESNIGKPTEPNEANITSKPTEPSTKPIWMELPCFQGDQPKCPEGVSSPPLILISLDGFRADYLERGVTPVLKRLSECGVSTPYIIPAFPSLTFPSHYTLVTGLYTESHGIVGNTMFDPVFYSSFTISGDEKFKSRWWGGEPIWSTAVKQGKRSATYFWPGSETHIQGVRPTYYFRYDGGNTYEQRVDVLRGWLSLPDDRRPDFITMYLNEPDHTGHFPGPDSAEENEMLEHVDNIIERLMDSIVELGMENCVNLLITTDHGMANRTCEHVYSLDNYINQDDYYSIISGGTMLRINPKSTAAVKDPKELVEALKCRHPAAVPSLKQDVPKRWHYANNRRIENTLVPVEAGYTALNEPSTWCSGGTHGYDNLSPYMKSLFLAYGPAFKQNVQVKPFQNIELYNMMCDILGLDPAPNNGTAGSLNHLLNHPKPLPLTPRPVSTPGACPYPRSDEQYNWRIAEDRSGCTCDLSGEAGNGKTIADFDKQLDLSATTEMAAKEAHAPFGMPEVDYEDNYCELVQSNYVTGYSHILNMPIFVSYTMEKRNRAVPVELVNCTVRPDVRIYPETSPNCTDYDYFSGDLENVTMMYLYPTGASDTVDDSMDARTTSNLVPSYPGFHQELWNGFLLKHLLLWVDEYNAINIVAGPIFDYNYDGWRDDEKTRDNHGNSFGNNIPFPTHFFVVLTRCTSGEELNENCTQLESVAFILPNKDGIQTCQRPSEYIEWHIATVHDVEKLTGLRLFPNLAHFDSIFLKQHVYLKGTLWKEWAYES